tara:strand:- start:37 stop:231 length:195 start_codon:yes stop_codon:yes gene_type:complete
MNNKMKTRKQISIINNNLEIIEIFEDLKELAECDSMDCVEKDNIMVSRINEIINELNNKQRRIK